MRALARLLQAGVFIGSSITAAIPVPVEIKSWPNIVAAVGYGIALASVKPESKRAVQWIIGTLIAGVLLGIACFWICTPRTLEINGMRYVRGQLQPSARENIEKRGISEKEYFQWSGKDPDNVWTRDSIAVNTVIIAALTSATMGFLAFGLMALFEYRSKPAPILKWVMMILAVAVVAWIAFWSGRHSPARATSVNYQRCVSVIA
jgi:hypothetical protein